MAGSAFFNWPSSLFFSPKTRTNVFQVQADRLRAKRPSSRRNHRDWKYSSKRSIVPCSTGQIVPKTATAERPSNRAKVNFTELKKSRMGFMSQPVYLDRFASQH